MEWTQWDLFTRLLLRTWVAETSWPSTQKIEHGRKNIREHKAACAEFLQWAAVGGRSQASQEKPGIQISYKPTKPSSLTHWNNTALSILANLYFTTGLETESLLPLCEHTHPSLSRLINVLQSGEWLQFIDETITSNSSYQGSPMGQVPWGCEGLRVPGGSWFALKAYDDLPRCQYMDPGLEEHCRHTHTTTERPLRRW